MNWVGANRPHHQCWEPPVSWVRVDFTMCVCYYYASFIACTHCFKYVLCVILLLWVKYCVIKTGNSTECVEGLGLDWLWLQAWLALGKVGSDKTPEPCNQRGWAHPGRRGEVTFSCRLLPRSPTCLGTSWERRGTTHGNSHMKENRAQSSWWWEPALPTVVCWDFSSHLMSSIRVVWCRLLLDSLT